MRTLIAYETAHGSTEAVAEVIAGRLRDLGADADLQRCRNVDTVEPYDTFVVGSPVWGGNWLKPARRFVRRFEEQLAQSPVAYFHTSGAAGDPQQRPEIEQMMERTLPAYAPGVEPLSIAAFAGVIDYDRYNFALRLVMKAVVGRAGGPTTGRHDMRDWDHIRSWADEIYHRFSAELKAAGET